MNEPRIGNLNPEAELERMAAEMEGLRAENEALRSENTAIKEQKKALEEKVAQLELLSTHDPLTGLLNRRGAEEQVELITAKVVPFEEEKEKRQERKNGRKFSVLSLDIDNFKRINDTYGHGIGDLVLKKTAEFLKTVVRKYDIVARWGGEEFLVVFQEIDSQKAINKFFNDEYRAEEFRVAGKSADTPNMPQLSFPVEVETEEGKKTINVTLSGGATDYIPGENISDAVVRSDKALYESKEGGRNRITKYREPGYQGK